MKPARIYPIQQVDADALLEVADSGRLVNLLRDRMMAAFEAYIESYEMFADKLRGPSSYKLKDDERKFRGCRDSYTHPLNRQRWADSDDRTAREQLTRAIGAEDWQEAMACAGMLCVRDMIHGRVVKAPAAKVGVKAVPKTAKKKPAAKKPATRKLTPPAARAPAPKAKKAAPADAKPVATLAALVEQAKPHFKANPNLDREGLIAKIGRRYERLTTFAELKILCAGKTPTTHSLKKAQSAEAKSRKDELLRMQQGVDRKTPADHPAQAWPFATKGKMPDDAPAAAAPKKSRPRRDPPPPAAAPSTPPAGARTKTWPETIPGTTLYKEDLAEHAAQFESGEVTSRFTALETENGWTHGCRVDIAELRTHDQKLRDDGPLALTADIAIRDAVAGALAFVKTALTDSEPPTDGAHALAPHVADLLKLRAWLLGFQAKGVERIKFLREQKSGQLELAA